MWKREITVKVRLGIFTSILEILLNCINIFVMKYYVKHITPLLEKIKIFCFSAANEGQTTLKYYFLPSFDKIKILVDYCVSKSDDVTNDNVI